MSDEGEREVIFETMRVGDVQRVAAIDVETGIEVVVQAPASAAFVDIRDLALRKLKRALAGDDENPPPQRPGKLV